MHFNINFLFDSFGFREEEIKGYDITKNNLNTLQDFIEFFSYLGMLFKDKKHSEINKFMDKLQYLGYVYNNNTTFDYTDENSIKMALVQFAFLLNLDADNEKASLCYFTCIELLKHF